MKILAVSSGGGHWEQLQRVRPAFTHAQIAYATTLPGATVDTGEQIYTITDCNRNNFRSNLRCLKDLFKIIRYERPNFIISTGAAPGVIALAVGKLFGARTIWLDSIANTEKLSLSGKIAGKFVDLWLTQWEHLSSDRGPKFWGSVL